MSSEIIAAVIAGVASGIPQFIVASGLTLIYGVMRILNFAHGALFMIGAYIFVAISKGNAGSFPAWIALLIVTALGLFVLGYGIESTVFRRLYEKDHSIGLLASYALLLALDGATEVVWGSSPRIQRQIPEFKGNVKLGDIRIAQYDIVLIAICGLLVVTLSILLKKTLLGKRIWAVSQDPSMSAALGIHVRRVQIYVFCAGSALAGLAGALVAPLVSVEIGLGPTVVAQSFAIVIIGGLGSIPGALVAAILFGLIESLAASFVPSLAGFSIFIGMGIILLLRPQGLFGNKHYRNDPDYGHAY